MISWRWKLYLQTDQTIQSCSCSSHTSASIAGPVDSSFSGLCYRPTGLPVSTHLNLTILYFFEGMRHLLLSSGGRSSLPRSLPVSKAAVLGKNSNWEVEAVVLYIYSKLLALFGLSGSLISLVPDSLIGSKLARSLGCTWTLSVS